MTSGTDDQSGLPSELHDTQEIVKTHGAAGDAAVSAAVKPAAAAPTPAPTAVPRYAPPRHTPALSGTPPLSPAAPGILAEPGLTPNAASAPHQAAQQYAPSPQQPRYAPPVPPAALAPQPQTQQPYAPQPYMRQIPGQPSGAKYWALGFLWFIPVIGVFVAPFVQGLLASQVKHHPNAVLRENARIATNWSLTVSLLTLVMNVLSLVILVSEGMRGLESSSSDAPMLMLGLFTVATWALGLAHAVFSIIGTVIARNRVWNPQVAIPFMKQQLGQGSTP